MIERLNRSMIYYSRFPYGKAPMKEPSTGFFGPKACLINEWAESGGENFASIFRLINAGPLIGRRTAGNLASTRGFLLLDGGVVMYPAEGKQNDRGEDVVENIGVLPDLETVNRPDDLIQGRDPQLERGILEVMKRLGKTSKNH
jgi:tricorn protease